LKKDLVAAVKVGGERLTGRERGGREGERERMWNLFLARHVNPIVLTHACACVFEPSVGSCTGIILLISHACTLIHVHQERDGMKAELTKAVKAHSDSVADKSTREADASKLVREKAEAQIQVFIRTRTHTCALEHILALT